MLAAVAGSIALARPKSSTFTVPSGRTLMFAGFRSRWTMPLLVRRFERLRDLLRDRAAPHRSESTPRAMPLRQVVALDEFHHEGVHATGLLESVDRGDVRMIQRRERLRLAFEARQAVGVRGERVRQDLDRDLAAKCRVRCAIHLPHTAFTDLSGDFVGAESRAGRHRQTLRIIRGWRLGRHRSRQRRRVNRLSFPTSCYALSMFPDRNVCGHSRDHCR